MPARKTRSKLHAKWNESWMIGVGHDGMILFDSCPVLECTISLAGWLVMIYIHFM